MDQEEVKNTLLNLKSELSARVERTHKHLYERKEPVSAKFSEQSVEMDNQELVFNLDAEGREELRLIESALERLEQGSYGVCQKCSESISPERLDAIPFVEHCIGCAS